MNQASCFTHCHEDLITDYEQTRGNALGATSGRGIGLTVFLRQGMASWRRDAKW